MHKTLLLPVCVAVATLATAGALVNYVELQAGSPGTPQTGNVNVTGSVIAGKVGVGTSSSNFPLAVLSMLDTTGVWSKTAGTAVTGQSTKAGTGYGGSFSASGTSARGVFGEATNTTGANYGGYFVSRSTDGTGVYGFANSLMGTNIGVRGKSIGMLGWAGYFEGRGYFSGQVGVGTTSPTAALHVSSNFNGIGLNANDLLFTNETNHFVGVGRTDPVTASEYFGIDAPTQGAQFGGMYVKTATGGIPFYGYYSPGVGTAYSYLDPSTVSWVLNVNGAGLYFDDAGWLGVGALPTAPLDVTLGANNLKFVNEGGQFPGITSGGTGANAGLIRVRNRVEIQPNLANTVAGYLDVRNAGGGATAIIDGATGKGTFYDSVVVDGNNGSTGTTAKALLFGGAGTGEGITSNRTSGANVGGLDFLTASLRRLSITTGGNVGVGTTSPGYKFEVRSDIGITNSSASTRLWARVDGADYGALTTYGSAATKLAGFGAGTGGVNTGAVFACDNAGNIQAGFDVGPTGVGTVYGDVKSFKVVNPRDNKSDIWYASIEGPEAAMYVRGKGVLVNGRAHVMFPEHFIDMAVFEGMTVQLTANSFDSEGLASANLSLTGFDVGELHKGRGHYEFFWEAKSVRKEHEGFQVVRPWDAILSASESKEQAWASRMRSIEAKKQNRPSRP